MDRRRNPISHSTPAWRQYRQAFDQFRDKVRNMQSLAAGGSQDQTAIDAAVLEMEMAKEDYKAARDTLFLEMIASENHRDPPPHPNRSEDEVRELAELLWELEGRPEGSALNDWYRAENIHRRSFKTCV
jgi:hypothetical protein